ncbi:DUF2730 family protein [uncultured Halopseudomonas sp.]|uniref:DUF2730 family protein n=1 Tax=uncultured Halopseudomonas sp. TaxID=2901193 RepID=UPI0030EF0DCD|tara:strand:- start:3722 stop:4042 length:321 start_codon:yes stop_codon:yes gene_type:complete
MDIDTVIRFGQFVFTVAVGLFSIIAARKSSSKADAKELASRMNHQDSRILTLEQQLLHMPDSQQMSELAGDMKAIKAELAGVARELAPLARSLDRINDYLLNARSQ